MYRKTLKWYTNFTFLHQLLGDFVLRTPDSTPLLDYCRSSPVNPLHCKTLGTPMATLHLVHTHCPLVKISAILIKQCLEVAGARRKIMNGWFFFC